MELYGLLDTGVTVGGRVFSMQDQMSRRHFCGQMVSSELRCAEFQTVLLCNKQGALKFLSLHIYAVVCIYYMDSMVK